VGEKYRRHGRRLRGHGGRRPDWRRRRRRTRRARPALLECRRECGRPVDPRPVCAACAVHNARA